jgi:hypothetical protein
MSQGDALGEKITAGLEEQLKVVPEEELKEPERLNIVPIPDKPARIKSVAYIAPAAIN